MQQTKKIVDGCTAAAYAAYALSELVTVYPITPVASMGDTAQRWAIKGVKNFCGMPLQVKELESELGAAGATHGALTGGTLATTFTSSQGLMLMIPNMFKMAGELLPAVFHVGCRSVATHALSIFGDHSDIMATRSTGFAILMSSSVQETHDLGIVAHLAAVDGRVPVLHGFDGFRTSNEMQTIDMLDYNDIFTLVDRDKIQQFRERAMNPTHPDVRGTAQNPDVYFQNREACNPYYDNFPAIVEKQMQRLGDLCGRRYHAFDYAGAPDAEYVIVAMGSSVDVIEETVEYLVKQGRKVGVLKVRLYRPFSAELMLKALPESVKRVAVLDRTKEPGAFGEPLFTDVTAALHEAKRDVETIGGRYGLSSKNFDPSMVLAVFDELAKPQPKQRFTVGIDDDVTNLSLDYSNKLYLNNTNILEAQFYGIGGDGTVGATKQAASIIGNADGLYAQAYFQYSAKKSSGYTVSQLRISSTPVKSEYDIEQANYISCNKCTYVDRFDLAGNLAEGGTFVLASPWTTVEQLDRVLPAKLKREIATKKAKLYNVDAHAIAVKHGLGIRINTIMETVFLHLCQIRPFSETYPELQERVKDAYSHEGMQVAQANLDAISEAVAVIVPIDYPASWAEAEDTPKHTTINVPEFITKDADPCLRREGDKIPVSAVSADGRVPVGTTAYEKRRIALRLPEWDADKCITCTLCSLSCPHAAIRPYLLDDEEMKNAPADLTTRQAEGKIAAYKYRIQIYPDDCTGCGSCSLVCPGHALTMVPIDDIHDEQAKLLDYCQNHVSIKAGIVPRNTINGSQFYEPMLEFSGACAGCGETPYVKLVTQLFGERMIVANATGCSSIWSADYPSMAWCANHEGKGAAWGNSLFEDNAEYAYGIAVATKYRRETLAANVSAIIADTGADANVVAAAKAWLAAKDSAADSQKAGDELLAAISKAPERDIYKPVTSAADMLGKKSIWAIGGDGWAYDIGFAGLDHVLAQDIDINMLVLDTECYSNTGGQTSKATPVSCMAKYNIDGKRTFKKDLARMMMTYGNIYVATIALGGDFQQAIDALVEAEAYPGPSLVICYCPCLEHGIRVGLGHSILVERAAVKSGYWPLMRYNPALAQQGKNPLTVDSVKPDGSVLDFINGEDRYADLKVSDPKEAAVLQGRLSKRIDEVFDLITSEETLNI